MESVEVGDFEGTPGKSWKILKESQKEFREDTVKVSLRESCKELQNESKKDCRKLFEEPLIIRLEKSWIEYLKKSQKEILKKS